MMTAYIAVINCSKKDITLWCSTLPAVATLAVVSVYRQNYNHQIINEMNEAYSENLSLITEYNNKK